MRSRLALGLVALLAVGGVLSLHYRDTPAIAAHTVRLKAEKYLPPPNHATPTGDTGYPAQGILLAAAPPDYTPVVTASEALSAFQQQPVPVGALAGEMSTLEPDVSLHLVTENSPTYAGLAPGATFPAWVVTYSGVTPISYGPAPLAQASAMACKFVGILDLDSMAWTSFFESCT
jgi:hypothetical protein